MQQDVIQLDTDSWVTRGMLPNHLAELDFAAIWALHPANYNQIKIYGKMVTMPRYTQTYLKNYTYSGVEHIALPLPDILQPFFEWANNLMDGMQFNQVLVNWYQDGSHYIGAHADNERQLVRDYPIISISLGAERLFRIRDKETKEVVSDIVMKDCSYMVMCGKMQQNYTHEVPKVMGRRGDELGPRINITFRNFK